MFLLQSEMADGDLAWSQYYAMPKTEQRPVPRCRRWCLASYRTKEIREMHRRVLVVVRRAKRFVQDQELVETYKCPSHEVLGTLARRL